MICERRSLRQKAKRMNTFRCGTLFPGVVSVVKRETWKRKKVKENESTKVRV